MSDQPNPKQSPNRAPQEPRPFNWKALLLLSVALLLVGWAIVNPSTLGSGTEVMKYVDFRRSLDQGRVLINHPNPKLGLKLISRDVTGDVVIGGYMKPEWKMPAQPQKESYAFKVPVHLISDAKVLDELRNRLELPVREVASREALPGQSADTRELSFAEFRKAAAFDEIQAAGAAQQVAIFAAPGSNAAVIYGMREEVKNRTVATDDKGKELQPQYFEVKSSSELQRSELNRLVDQGAAIDRSSDYLKSAIFTFLPFLLLILLLFFLFRQQMKASGRGAMSFGKSKARLLTMDRNKVTFKDVAGIQEAKEELWEIVDFLRDPRKFQRLGGSIPKGVLMVGSPGTGKTLLARAIAGEADVPFFSISGSDFVEMFVGVGASRVRDMFEQGKKHAPCLIFIDEIDAVGRHRGHGMGGGHDEREQTLNQLLVEMDGFDTQEGVIIIAATNRPDVLDPALLRPGRFDRQVTVSLPDVNGREEILKVHVKKIKLAAGTDLAVIARGTPGFSGAELANLVNEAALLAARKNLSAVTLAEMEEARDKVRWGRERRSLAMSDKEKTATAWHEAGHAILLAKLENAQPLHKVTIIPRGPSLGSTMWLPEGDRYSKQRKEALDDLAVAVGGRIAESFYTSDVSNGASGDIRMATNLARTMVCAWGMSEKLGMVEYGDDDSPVFLARDMSRGRNYSEETARLIDAEIKGLVDEAFERATKLLTEYKDKVELLAKALLDYETLDADHVREILETGEMKNPPTTPKPPPIPDEFRKGGTTKAQDEEKPDDNGTLPGEVVGAPA